MVGDYYSRLAPAVRYGKSLLPIVMEVTAFDEATGERVWTKDFSEEFRDNALAKTKVRELPLA